MDSVIRCAIIYGFLLVIFRVSGKRTMSEITTFDLVLLLIISEATQQAMISDDYSVTNGIICVTTLVALDILLSIVKQRWKWVEKWTDGLPLVLVKDGEMLAEQMDKSRVNRADILHAARELQGLERLDQVKYAVLEQSGGITIIPKER